MATPLKGDVIFLQLDDTAIECLTEAAFEMSAEKLDVTCKNTGGNKSYLPGAKTYTFNVSGNYTDGTTSNKDWEDLFDAFVAGTTLTAKWGRTTTGGKAYAGSATITNLSANSPNTGGITTWSATLEVDGAITKSTVS